jgi:hypothetical protein
MVSPQKRNFDPAHDDRPEQYVRRRPSAERIKRDAYAVGEARAVDTDEMWFPQIHLADRRTDPASTAASAS